MLMPMESARTVQQIVLRVQTSIHALHVLPNRTQTILTIAGPVQLDAKAALTRPAVQHARLTRVASKNQILYVPVLMAMKRCLAAASRSLPFP